MRDGVDAMVDVPRDRWDVRRFYSPDPARPGKMYVRQAGFLRQSIDAFDTSFFAMSPREAARLDPQQRLLLEVAWEALEDAGLSQERLQGSNTGVFVGGFMIDSYVTALGRENRELIDAHTATGIGQTMLSARIAYFLDLHGPALTVDTACSSSLVAVHYACQSLRSGECTTALVGGVNVIFSPNVMISLCKAGLLSPDARCHAFDARANGYARGEGAGVVVLRPLSTALAEGDAIYAIIRGSGVNQDGRSEGSITAPNRDAQEQLMATVYARAGVNPREVQYVEAHGTGTAVGDATEAGALGRVLGAGRAGGPCLMGSVKTNIGHLEGAAGVAGLIKAALALQHRQIPPNLHHERPNPAIPFAELALRVPVTLESWPATAGPRYAGVNSFGYGGTNAHAVLEEAPPPGERPAAPAETAGMRLVPISARSESALRALVRAYLQRLETPDELRFDDLQHTLALRRSHHDFRLVALCPPRLEALRAQLAAYASGGTAPGLWVGTRRAARPPRVAWVLSGMGPQWWAMGRELLDAEPLFRDVVERCDRQVRVLGGWSLLDELTAGEERSRMHATEVSQPANFALQMGLAAMWQSWGLKPDAVVGHSTGEVAAACIAGALGFEDGVRVAYHRGRVLAMAAGKGGMLAVGLGASELAPFLDGYEAQVSIAAINAPRSCTLAGDSAALQEIAGLFEKRGVFHRPLKVEVPYHSPAIDSLRDELRAALDGLAPRAPLVPLISSVTAEPVTAAIHDAEYWCRNIRDVVRFSDSIQRLLADGVDTFVEIGPHPVLSQPIAECAAQAGKRAEIVHSLQRGKPEKDTLLAGLARLVAHGAAPDWSRLVSPGAGFVRLPSYPWQRERHWAESDGSLADRLGADQHPLLGARTDFPSPQWRSEIDLSRLEYLADHAIQGEPVYPGAAYLEAAIAMAKELHGPGPCVLRNVAFHRALGLRVSGDTLLHSSFDPQRESFTIHGQAGGGRRGSWILHASGEAPRPDRLPAPPPPVDIAALRHGAEEIPPAELYRRLAARGYDYGPAFQRVQRCFVSSGEASCEVRVPPAMAAPAAPYTIHPAVLDACFHSLLSAMPSEGVAPAGVAYLPVRIGQLLLRAPLGASLWCHARILRCDDQQLEGSIRVHDESGATVLEMDGISARALARSSSLTARPYAGWLYRFEWEKVERPTATGAEERSWLILGSDDGLGAKLAAALREQGERAEAAHAGAIGKLLPAVAGRDSRCRIVYLTRAASVAGDARPAASPDDVAVESSLDVVRLVQALAGAPWRTPPRLVLVTRTAARVATGDRSVLPGESALQGLARVILTEHPELGGKHIDLARDFNDPRALVQELTAGDDHDEEIALRGAARFAPRLRRVRAEELDVDLAPRIEPLFRADATFLVTGGLGGFGLALASWMVGRGARHLVLAGRRGVTSPAVAEAVAALERRGADIVVARTDVSNRPQVTELIGEIARRGYPLRGVFHAAANLDPGADGFLLQLDEGRVRSMMDPKVRGAWNLHLETLELPLDYFVLFSSVAALFGFQGLGAYAAGNAFLDGLSHLRRARGLTALSVNWGAVKDVGVLTRLQEHQRAGELSGAEGAPANELLEALEPLLAGSQAQIAVGKHAWNTWARVHPASARSRRFSDPGLRPAGAAPDGAGSRAVRDVILALDPAERRDALIAHLRGVCAVLLGAAPERIDADAPLDQLGLTSLTAAQLTTSLDADLGMAMPLMTLLAEAVTVAQLADRALGHLGRSAPGAAAGGLAPAAPGAEVDALAAGIAESEPVHLRAPIDSGTLHVARWASGEPGNRPPLVIVHGLWEEWRLWEHVAARLARHRQVFLVDLRGHGESAKLPAGYHPDDHARDLERVLTLVDAPRVDLLAFCIGATAATKVAARVPLRVRRLILQEPWNGHLDRERMRMLCALKQQSAEKVHGTLRELFPTRPAWAIEKLTQALRHTADAVFNAAVDSPEELFDQSGVLGAVKVPTLLLRADPARGGEMDEPFCAQLLGTLRAAELVDFPDTSRAIQVERPDALVAQVERFLESDTWPHLTEDG